MSRMPRTGRDVRRSPARGASPPGTGEPRASQPEGQGPHLASGPGRDDWAARFIQDMAAGARGAVGHTRPASAAAHPRWRTIPMPRLPHAIQLCIHCRHNPAGFWVRRDSDQTVRRPWCLSCCQDLDPGCYHVSPFDP
jgi:hypothetical protein